MLNRAVRIWRAVVSCVAVSAFAGVLLELLNGLIHGWSVRRSVSTGLDLGITIGLLVYGISAVEAWWKARRRSPSPN